MRRSLLSTGVVAALGLSLVGAPCGGPGPQSRTFAAGSLVIPMDSCYQTRGTPPAGVACNAGGDDGVFRAYGLVYFLLKHGVTVYWMIDPSKTSVTGVDATVAAPATGSVAQKMSWANGTFADFGIPAGSSVNYIGAPFAIDSADAAAVVDMLTNPANPNHGDFARFQAEATRTTPAPITVEIHKVQNGFTAAQVRPLVGPPPRLAILNVNPLNLKTSVNVMYEYAVAAGLSWPCVGNGDCAGGVTGTGVNTAANPGQGCDLNALYAYLASPSGDPAIPRTCTGSVCAPNFNAGPGLIYDILCDNDFYSSTSTTGGYAVTKLAQNGYKLLWAPHWQEGGTAPSATPAVPPTTAGDILGTQLANIAAFVDAGNNLFAECHAIVTLEGGVGTSGTEVGLPATRFHSTAGMESTNGTGSPISFLIPTHPNVQIADFPYSMVSGSVTTYYPDRAGTPTSAYRTGVDRLITEVATPPWDVSTINRKDNVQTKGNVAYLGGHRYTGQTAGTRLVLNTLFNLGIGCADPGTACNTGKLGICAAGTLRCASGGGLECVQTNQPAPAEICGNGLDDNCNGLVDEGCGPPPVCTDGAQRTCYDGATGCTGTPGGTYTCAGVCKSGTQVCAGGAWGPCANQVLPSPEVCNLKDDNCNGSVDEGTTCPLGYACASGICLPAACSVEGGTPCPMGYNCSAVLGGTCTAVACPTTTCGPGLVCQGGATPTCVDPCAGTTCGAGSACSGGFCTAGGCHLTGCSTGQACVGGSCVATPCAALTCPTGTFCRVSPLGASVVADCVRSCVYVSCPAGEVCGVDGFCVTPESCSPACVAGQTCARGTCVPDPCYGVGCGAGQVCSGGACVDDPCSLMSCPVGSCVAGQCAGQPPGGSYTQGQAPEAKSGCGCGSAGGVELLGLALGGLALAPLRRRPLRTRRRPSGGGAGAAAVLAAAVLGLSSGCGSSSTKCQGGQTACGDACVDLTADGQNCGACARSCNSGFTCSGGGCVLPTGNPFLKSIDPPSSGVSSSVTLTFSGDGFLSGARARFNGAGLDGEQALTVGNPTSATLTLSLSAAVVGAAQVRVVNPGQLVSNAVPFYVGGGATLLAVFPASGLQDQTVTIDLTGAGFAPGATATFTPIPPNTFSSPPMAATFLGDTHVQVSGLALVGLGVGAYNLTVTNPGGTPSNALAFTVNPGAPVLTGISPTSARTGTVVNGTATGSWFYPSSVVHVSGPGLADSPLPTLCASGTDAVGRCNLGQLGITADLTGIATGSYSVTVVNPGSPSPLASTAQTFTVNP